jgi:hypothetical protein
MSLSDAISYVSERCKCTSVRAGKAIYVMLGEGALVTSANILVRDVLPGGQPRWVDAGIEPVPARLWAGYPWPTFSRRTMPSSKAEFREQTADGRGIGPLYSNPTLATADIDAWLDRGGRPDSGDIIPAYPTAVFMKAELCLNGHVITGDIEEEPEKRSEFCKECGAKTIRNCPECGARLRGDHVVREAYHDRITRMTTPSYCHGCGTAFPWTNARIAAAKEHAAEIEGLDEHERQQLPGIIDDLASGGSRTELAAGRFNRIMKKVAPAVSSVFRKVVVDIASETAKKLLGGL